MPGTNNNEAFFMKLFLIISFSILILFHFFKPVASKKAQISPNFREGKFHNQNKNENVMNFWDILKFLASKREKWPEWIDNTHIPELKNEKDEENIVLTFINHASFLIEIENFKIITDPIFSERASPFSWLGPKRKRAPGLSLEQLPKIDLVLISHNHYDHLDLPSLRKIEEKFSPKIIVPIGDADWLRKKGFKNVTELDWHESESIENLEIHFVPAQHSTNRKMFDVDQSFWGGYVIKHPKAQIFHAGDTGYAGHFKEIGNKFDIDIALLPIGDYKPKDFLYLHMGPKEAVQAHLDLRSKISFPMHYETFQLSALANLEAENELKEHLKQNPQNFKILQVGQSFRQNLHQRK